MRRLGRLLSFAVVIALADSARAADDTQTVEQLRNAADASARAGQAADEAAAFESMILRDPSMKSVLGDRLVHLYISIGQPQKAMDWAREIMKTNPDPQAYLAGVYALLNSFTEARAILEKEISETKDPSRKIVLLWQLADVNEDQNHLPEAGKNLQRALELAHGTPSESQAQARLDLFAVKHAPRTDEDWPVSAEESK